MKYKNVIIMLFAFAVLTAGLFAVVHTGETGVSSDNANKTEALITIDKPGTSPLAEADSLKDAYKLKQAIELYKTALDKTDLTLQYRKEAEYNIGVCQYWLDKVEAEKIFKSLPEKYPDDSDLRGFCEHCLALIDVQNGKYNEAINRLQGVFADKSFTDNELYARTLFQIGKIYLNFLNNRASAKIYFNRVASEYPHSKAAGHRYVKDNSK